MSEASLEKMGLTKGEAKVYLALLELGGCTAGPIIARSRVSPSKIYDVLARLAQKGLASYIYEGKTKVFRPTPPSGLSDFIEKQREELAEREANLKALIPTLKKMQAEKSENQKAEILEGVRGIRSFFDLSLNETRQGDEICVMGYPPAASRLFNAYFKAFHKRRAERKIPGKVIYNHDTWFLKAREPRKYLGQRYLPKGVEPPAFIYIFRDYVGTIIITEKQKLCFMIKNREVARSYMDYFKLMWKQALPTKS